jgi:hypothetical protein
MDLYKPAIQLFKANKQTWYTVHGNFLEIDFRKFFFSYYW